MRKFILNILFLIFLFLTATENVLAQPAVFFTQRDSGCINSVFPFHAVVVSPGDPVVQYTWDFGDGTPPVNTASATELHQFGITGIFDVKLFVTTQSGDTASLMQEDFIKVGVRPTAIIDSGFYDICFHGAVQFNSLSLPPVTGWQWIFGDGSRSFEQNPYNQFIFDTSGIADPFDITLIAYNNGCPDTDIVANMVAVRGPIPDFSYSYDCSLPYSVSFTNLSGGADNYAWDFGDGSPLDTATHISHLYNVAGIYSVKLTCTNISNNCSVDTTYQVEVTDTISAAIHESGPFLICEPHGSQYFYEWFFNGSPLGTCTTDTCDAQQSGIYHVIVTDFNSNCSDTADFYSFSVSSNDLEDAQSIMIFPNPVDHETLTVDFGKSYDVIYSIYLYDATGRMMIREKVDPAENSFARQFDLSSMDAGIYFLNILSESKTIVRKIIKQ